MGVSVKARRSATARVGAGVVTGLAVLAQVETVLLRVAHDQWGLVARPGPSTVDEVVVAVVATGACLLSAWLAAGTLAALVAHLPGAVGRRARTWADAWAPGAVRRVATVVVGAAVGGVLAPGSAAGTAPAPPAGFTATAPREATAGYAAVPGAAEQLATGTRPPAGPTPGFSVAPSPAPSTAHPASPAGRAAAPDPGWTPTRPLDRPQASPRLVAGPSPRTAQAPVVVLRGDTLWSIAARHLGPDATDAEIAHEWPRWYAANRTVLGDDPDLLLPGQVLLAPGRTAEVAR
jgi:hypothetical protein